MGVVCTPCMLRCVVVVVPSAEASAIGFVKILETDPCPR